MTDPHEETVVSELIRASKADSALDQFQNLVSAHQYLRLYDTIARCVQPGKTVLDWGSGNGHFSYYLVRSGYLTCGYGFNDVPQVCRDLPDKTYVYRQGSTDDPVRIPYEDQSFDAVVSVGVLEHVRESGGDEISSLREIHRLLKPGGVFICYHLPNQYSLIEWVLRRVGRWSHKYRYTQRDILSLASSADLRVVETMRYAILPRNIWFWANKNEVSLSRRLARVYDRLDDALSLLASPICQNYLFVAERARS